MTATTLLVVPRSIPMILGMSLLLERNPPAHRETGAAAGPNCLTQTLCQHGPAEPAFTPGFSIAYGTWRLPNHATVPPPNAKSTVGASLLPLWQNGRAVLRWPPDHRFRQCP